MNWNRPFAPNFLKKFDHKLLLNKPETWSARTHLVWYYGILFCLILAGVCFIYPNDARSSTRVFYWIFFVAIISGLALIFWLIYLLRFNVFKRFGNISGINRLKVFGLYFASVAMIGFFTYVPPIVETIRANHKYKDGEIVRDINSFNKLVNQLEYDSLEHKWAMDTVVIVSHEYNPLADYIYEKLDKGTYTDVTSIDSSNYFGRIEQGDTLVNLFDSVYQIYTCPSYQHLSARNADEFTKEQVFSKKDIYRNTIVGFQKPDVSKAKEEIEKLMKKYFYELPNTRRYSYGMDYTSSNSQDTTYEHRMEKRYEINNVRESLENIVERKYCFSGNAIQWQFRVLFYVSFFITLLLFVFRHSTTKTFFLSILTAIILSILTGLLIAFSNGDSIAFFGWLIFYTLLFCACSFIVFGNKIRSVVTGICINLFVMSIPFLPLMIVGLYEAILRETYNRVIYAKPIDHDKIAIYFGCAEVLGIVFFLILLPTIIHKLYRKWFALPQE